MTLCEHGIDVQRVCICCDEINTQEKLDETLDAAVKAEREACAKAVLWCSQLTTSDDDMVIAGVRKYNAGVNAAHAAIRARGEKGDGGNG